MRGTDSRVAGWLGAVKFVTLIFRLFAASGRLVFFLFPVLLAGFFGYRSSAGVSVHR